MFKRLLLAFGLALLLPVSAYASSVAQETPGYLFTANCPGNIFPCYIQYGGLTIKSVQVANNTTSIAVDANPGQLIGVEAYNNSGTIAYIKLYNATQGSTTCGSGTPVDRKMIPANASGAGFIGYNTWGALYTTAITACITTGFADSDSTAPAASTYIVNFYFK